MNKIPLFGHNSTVVSHPKGGVPAMKNERNPNQQEQNQQNQQGQKQDERKIDKERGSQDKK